MIYLGTIEPVYTAWRLFPNSSINGKFLRVTFQAADGLPLENMRTFVLLRRYWSVTTPPTVERAKKVYPTNNAVVIHNPIPEDYQALGLFVCDWQIKLGFKWKDLNRPEIRYTVSLEEE